MFSFFINLFHIANYYKKFYEKVLINLLLRRITRVIKEKIVEVSCRHTNSA